MTTDTPTQQAEQTDAQPEKDATFALMIMAEEDGHEILDAAGKFGDGEGIGCEEIVEIAVSAALKTLILSDRHPAWKEKLLAEFGTTIAAQGQTWETIHTELDAALAAAQQAAAETDEQPATHMPKPAAEPDYFGESFSPRQAVPSLPDAAEMLAAAQAGQRLGELPAEEREVGMMAAIIARQAGAEAGYGTNGPEIRYGAKVAQSGIALGLALAEAEPDWTKRAKAASQAARMGFAGLVNEAAQKLLGAARSVLAGHGL